MEEQDRYRYFLRDADDQLAVLAEHGLVEFEGQRVRLLAAAEQAGRAVVDPGFARAVAEEWAANWIASLEVAADVEKPGLLAHAAPYLRRLGRWDELAALEDRLGRHDRAVEAKAEALRRAYEAGDPGEIGTGHHDFAVLLGRLDRASPAVLAHYLASALIAVRTNAPTLGAEIEMIAMFAFAFGLPERIALDDICALAGETGGVRLRELLDRLPQEVPDELQQVVDRAMERAGEAMRDWTPVMTAVVLHASGAADLTGQLETALAGLERGADSAPLARALRRVLAGERGPELLDGLGMLPSGIVGKVLASLRERAGS
ncbi:hypothetical protein SAMN05216188_109135 [Lentzea xinjiangensis]|uniref:Uncharacterized protein n=1 Tax=Lentzea xinjiangensis TaxID=402600 RepID=A0A1H9MM35_9PSEU|nr:hypothetical protein [Lentzea xinjiangensis]SER24760.1 hypothetical protein SAMN05216188_109135 [Lentzea xinjiangensis]